ncbi:MAG: hypothetical protein P8O16_04735 [Algoriphagus sp.]|uniref:hypothetical protein n=1 Tax=Algoriphagus sp. TaxID=1872435 RepID=UPI00260AB905|nr:hypothetical protein [Algoriphagus sp.]MDG1276564.1 hypothetical protein [Algoriphagus sp.]
MANAQGVFLASIVQKHLRKNNVIPDQSTIDFIHWTELGKLFEFLNGKLKFPTGKDREVFKEKLWMCVMSHNKAMKMVGYKMVYSALEREVPQVLEVITEVKEHDHTRMAFLLQNAEAEVMMNCFEKIIDKSSSSLLHDAMYFPTAHLEKNVNGFITELKSLEIRCTVKVLAKYDNTVLPTGHFNTVDLQKVRYDIDSIRKGIFLSFAPEKRHLDIIKENIDLFEEYPIKLKAHVKPKFGRSLNEDFVINFESQKNNQAMYNSGILHSMLVYAGSGMANLRLSDVSTLSPFDLLDIVEMSDSNHIQKIFIGDQEISFQLLLMVWMKNNFDMCQEFEKGLILDLVKHNLDFISNLVFGNNPLPDEVFPYGYGCYQIDEKQFLLALNSQTEKSPILKLFEKLYSQDLVFQIICKDQLDHLFGTLDYLKSDIYLFENRLHQLDFKSYVKYLENWLKANCIELKDGEILVYPENLDDDDFYQLHG